MDTLWIIISLGVLLCIAATLLFSRRFRLPLASCLCLLGIAANSWLWFADRADSERIHMGYSVENSDSRIWWYLVTAEAVGQVQFVIGRDARPFLPGEDRARGRPPTNPSFTWTSGPWDKGRPEPLARDTTPFGSWGFELFWDMTRGRHLVMMVVPNWFAIIILFIIPAIHARAILSRRKIARRIRNGCCAQCGFDLRGTPTLADASKRCSECGRVNPSPSLSSRPSTTSDSPAPGINSPVPTQAKQP